MRQKLTAKKVEQIYGQRTALADRITYNDTARDLCLRVGPRSASWGVFYRIVGSKKVRYQKIGTYPSVSLAEAAERAQKVKRTAEEGKDPKVVRLSLSRVRDASQAYLEQRVSQLQGQSSYRDAKRYLKVCSDAFGDLPLSAVSKVHITGLLASMSNTPYAANRCFSTVRSFFNWCVAGGLLETSPVTGLRAPHRESRRERYLTSSELAKVWIAAGKVRYPWGPWIRMMIATGGQRRTDVATMSWLDIKDRLWRNANPTKSDKPVHEVPLNRIARDLLADLPRFSKGDYVFTTTEGERPISGFSKGIQAVSKDAGVYEWSAHTLRHTFATLACDELDVLPDEVAMIQNRTSEYLRGAERVYTKSTFIKRKRRILKKWSAFVKKISEE